MNTKKLAEKAAGVTGDSKGICAAMSRLTKRRSVIDIVEPFRPQYAVQKGTRNEGLPPLDERRGCVGHYSVNRMI